MALAGSDVTPDGGGTEVCCNEVCPGQAGNHVCNVLLLEECSGEEDQGEPGPIIACVCGLASVKQGAMTC